MGQKHHFNFGLEEEEISEIIDEITSSAYKLARQKIGCLIAVERDTKLKTYIESGIGIDAKISSELIQSVFNPQSPIHDGGIVTRGNRIAAVSCLFPLSDNPNFSKILRTFS